MKRQLVLIGNFLPDRQESMLRFLRVLESGFGARGWKVDTVTPRPRFATLAGPYRYGGLPKYLGYLDKFVVFPRTLRARTRNHRSGTVYHIVDHSNAVYQKQLRKYPLAVTCHDLLQVRSALGEIPQNPLSSSGAKYQRWILRHLTLAPNVVCVSHKTKSDFCRLTHRSAEEARVIHMGLNYPYSPMPTAEANDRLSKLLAGKTDATTCEAVRRGAFFAGVGGAQWYKNRTGLISLFASLQSVPNTPTLLVYVGPEFDPEQQRMISESGSQVIRLSQVDNEDLRALYSRATALLFPSWEEGFGWPIAEAQACGCPVFATNRAPMTEVGGEAARYFDPADIPAAIRAILEALSERERLVSASLASANRWDTNRMLDAYALEYQRLIQEIEPRAAVSS